MSCDEFLGCRDETMGPIFRTCLSPVPPAPRAVTIPSCPRGTVAPRIGAQGSTSLRAACFLRPAVCRRFLPCFLVGQQGARWGSSRSAFWVVGWGATLLEVQEQLVSRRERCPTVMTSPESRVLRLGGRLRCGVGFRFEVARVVHRLVEAPGPRCRVLAAWVAPVGRWLLFLPFLVDSASSPEAHSGSAGHELCEGTRRWRRAAGMIW